MDVKWLDYINLDNKYREVIIIFTCALLWIVDGFYILFDLCDYYSIETNNVYKHLPKSVVMVGG